MRARAAPNTAPSWQVHVIACHEKGRLIIAAKDRKSVVPQRFCGYITQFRRVKRKTVSSASTSDSHSVSYRRTPPLFGLAGFSRLCSRLRKHSGASCKTTLWPPFRIPAMFPNGRPHGSVGGWPQYVDTAMAYFTPLFAWVSYLNHLRKHAYPHPRICSHAYFSFCLVL